ncbi:winged helix-turn-helix transcriptional regulator [Liquorilactobacillus uvarum]|nr:helix-turn-helix domain-containing protein [Liquorilactobacillus uvarum]
MQTTDEWSCGVSKVMDVFAGKWKLNILWIIYNEEGIRFNQLKNRTVGITNIMLTRSLETLTSEKIISNNLIGNKPPFKSEYYLTTKGKSLVPLMQSLNDWGKNNL